MYAIKVNDDKFIATTRYNDFAFSKNPKMFRTETEVHEYYAKMIGAYMRDEARTSERLAEEKIKIYNLEIKLGALNEKIAATEILPYREVVGTMTKLLKKQTDLQREIKNSTYYIQDYKRDRTSIATRLAAKYEIVSI